MNDLGNELNYLENEILNYKTNINNRKEVEQVYTYHIPWSGQSKGDYLQRLDMVFKGGYSPFVSISATGTVDGKDISNPENGGIGFRSVSYYGIGDYVDADNESYAILSVSNPVAKYNQIVNFSFTITVKSMTEITLLKIGDFRR